MQATCRSFLLFILSAGAYQLRLSYHLMIGGSILLVFVVFMISITQPEHYYQVRSISP